MKRTLMKFQLDTGGWLVGWYYPDTDEFELPSGYRMSVENGQVFYLGKWYTLLPFMF